MEWPGSHSAQQNLAIDYRHCAAETLAAEGARFDVVLNMEVVEHVADLSELSERGDGARQSGPPFRGDPEPHPRRLCDWHCGGRVRGPGAPKGTHQWGRFVKPSELASHLDRGGLTVMARTGVRVNPGPGAWPSPLGGGELHGDGREKPGA